MNESHFSSGVVLRLAARGGTGRDGPQPVHVELLNCAGIRGFVGVLVVASMLDFVLLFLHLIVTLVRLPKPGGLRSFVAESVLLGTEVLKLFGAVGLHSTCRADVMVHPWIMAIMRWDAVNSTADRINGLVLECRRKIFGR